MGTTRNLFWFAGLALIVSQSMADVYKWVDEDGQVHYGDRPAENAQEMQIKKSHEQKLPEQSDQQRRERQQRLLNAFEQERRSKQETRLKAEAEQKEKQEQCTKAREQLQAYHDSRFLYRKDEVDGAKPEILSYGEREKATQELAAQIAKHCK